MTDPRQNALGINDGIEYDVSGYKNHGTKTGTFSASSDTARYAASTVFNGSSTYIEAETKTISVWVKTNGIPSGLSIVFTDYVSKMALGFYNSNSVIVSSSTSFYVQGSCSLLGSYYNATGWNHFVVVKLASSFLVYLNCNLLDSTNNNYWSTTLNKLLIGCRNNGSY